MNKGSGSSMTQETMEGDLGANELLADVSAKEGRVAALCNTGRLFWSSEDAGGCSLDLTRGYVTSITPRFRGRSGEGGVRENGKQGDYHIAQCHDQALHSNGQSELLVHIPQPQPEAREE